MTYEDQLNDVRWHKLRFEVFHRDKYQCQVCRTGKNLNAHHLYYIKGRKAWEYKHELLITLCKRHHNLEHDSLKIFKEYHIKEHLTSGMLAIDIVIKINSNESINF
jgi:5-methylcytosine-specific restriction endonuclease McrA